MSATLLYSIVGLFIVLTGLYGVILYSHLLRKVLAINLMGTGIFMFLIALSQRSQDGASDPVPHAMVLTGIVVAVSATSLVLAFVVRLHAATGSCCLEEIIEDLKKQENS